MEPPPRTPEATDIFSLSDQVLSEKLQFIEEIGFGNWGSVWLCRPKGNTHSSTDGLDKPQQPKIAVKLVHRSKTSTTAARVRSLWNEMKIVRSLKNDPHQSIIPFHSFIITPSYALITMTYLPKLIPVEVDEVKAHEWFHSLLSGVEFLHQRGVVHNDIKPANILISRENVPVIVDFGFAEKYDRSSSKAFHSNLSYGTPEYLSPERARGMPHDTRKSDVWSLGVTFFEILVGRTPFEHTEGEGLSSKEDLEKYWLRTLRGKWVGTWKMSKGVEKLLQRMTTPNADLRCTASSAMADPYWTSQLTLLSPHKESTTNTTSLAIEDLSKRGVVMPPSSSQPSKEKESLALSQSLSAKPATESPFTPVPPATPSVTRVNSRPMISPAKTPARAIKRVPVPSVSNLSPIKASPPCTPFSASRSKENAASPLNSSTRTHSRKPFAPREPFAPISIMSRNVPSTPLQKKPSLLSVREKRRPPVLSDLTGQSRNIENSGKRSKVTDRVMEWEREKERLREMERLEDMERESDEEFQHERDTVKSKQPTRDRVTTERERVQDKRSLDISVLNVAEHEAAGLPGVVAIPSPKSDPPYLPFDNHSRRGSETGLTHIKHSIKMSIDKTLRLYKSSARGQAMASGRSTPARSLSIDGWDEIDSKRSSSERQSWEDDALVREAKSSLPVVRHALRTEQVAADNRQDRLNIWMRNVEKVVEDARQNFASTSVTPLPPLPLAPVSRSASHTRRSSQLPRRVLAANEIFVEDNAAAPSDQTAPSISRSVYFSARDVPPAGKDSDLSLGRSRLESSTVGPVPHTPRRRATISTRSPEPSTAKDDFQLDSEIGSPSKRKEKSKSHGNLLQSKITPISLLEFQLKQHELPTPSPRLSTVVDRSLFIAPPAVVHEEEPALTSMHSVLSTGEEFVDELPLHTDPSPTQKSSPTAPVPETPARRRDAIFDRFLTASSGVKRVGRGYQPDNLGHVHNVPHSTDVSAYKRNDRGFHSARQAMPPPVSNRDHRRTVSVDELGKMKGSSETPSTGHKLMDEGKNTIATFRRALKAVVTKPVSRKVSRIY